MEDAILDLTTDYVQYECYSQELTKEKKRVVQKRAAKLVMERGEVFLKKEQKVFAFKQHNNYYTQLTDVL